MKVKSMKWPKYYDLLAEKSYKVQIEMEKRKDVSPTQLTKLKVINLFQY